MSGTKSKPKSHVTIKGSRVYVMQPGDRIIKGPSNVGRMLETTTGEIMPWGSFVSSSRADAIADSRKRARKPRGKKAAKPTAKRTRK